MLGSAAPLSYPSPRFTQTLAMACVAALIGLGRPSGVSSQDLALTGANVVDVESGRIIADATVTIRGGVIESIVPGGAAPAGMEAVDLGGRYLSPGLMDAHVHLSTEAQAVRALQSGITTARNAGSSSYADVGLRDLIRAGYAQGPEMLAAGYHIRPGEPEAFWIDNPTLGRFRADGLRSPDAIAAAVNANLDRSVDFIKTTSTERAGLPNTDPRKQLYDAGEVGIMVREASARGIPVMAHAHGDVGARAAVEGGVRSIEHGTYMSRETLRIMVQRGTFLVPTVAIVADLTIPGGDYDNSILSIRGRHMLPRVREMARMAHSLGVKIVAATDTGYSTESTTRLAHELMEYVENIGS